MLLGCRCHRRAGRADRCRRADGVPYLLFNKAFREMSLSNTSSHVACLLAVETAPGRSAVGSFLKQFADRFPLGCRPFWAGGQFLRIDRPPGARVALRSGSLEADAR